MKTGKGLGIIPIKLEHRNSCKELDSLFESIQNDIYFFGLLFYNDKVKDYMLEQLSEIGKKLKNLSISRANDGQLKRRDELIEILRIYYVKLRTYFPDNNEEQVERMCKFLVSMFIKEKKETTNLHDVYLKWLKLTKEVSEFYTVTNSLKSVNNEAINYFKI